MPAVILVLLVAIFGAVAIWGVQPYVEGLVGTSDAWYSKLGAGIVSWLGAAMAGVLGLLLALAVTPPLSGPALEHIVGLQERALGVRPRAPVGLLTEMWCGLRAQVFAALFVVPILLVLWIVELLVPPAAVVTVPVGVVVAAFGLAWNLFDYPLTLRNVRMRERFAFIATHKRETLGFGLAFTALFWIPCFGVLMLPVGAAAATRTIWSILEADPDSLPSLPRSPGGRSVEIDGNADLSPQAEVPVAGHEQQ